MQSGRVSSDASFLPIGVHAIGGLRTPCEQPSNGSQQVTTPPPARGGGEAVFIPIPPLFCRQRGAIITTYSKTLSPASLLGWPRSGPDCTAQRLRAAYSTMISRAPRLRVQPPHALCIRLFTLHSGPLGRIGRGAGHACLLSLLGRVRQVGVPTKTDVAGSPKKIPVTYRPVPLAGAVAVAQGSVCKSRV